MDTVLLLNASYEPLRILPWKRAIRLWTMGRVEVIEESTKEIRTINFVVRLPSVVRLLRYVNYHGPLPKFSRVNVYRRDDFTCGYCGKGFIHEKLNLDHVIPRSHGGQTIWENVVTTCHPCNSRKANRTPAQANMKLLVKPYKPARLNSLMLTLSGNPPEAWKQYLPSH